MMDVVGHYFQEPGLPLTVNCSLIAREKVRFGI
jgi:hypothetical protein